jgi:hypothetical protein
MLISLKILARVRARVDGLDLLMKNRQWPAIEKKHLFGSCNSCWCGSVDMYLVVSNFHIIKEREVIPVPLIMDEL